MDIDTYPRPPIVSNPLNVSMSSLSEEAMDIDCNI